MGIPNISPKVSQKASMFFLGIVERRGDDIDITVTADGYLYNMVRILAGTLCEAGAGRLAPEAVPGILASCDRKNAGPTLAAKGLFLKSVDYD